MRVSLNWLSEYLDVAPIRADLKGVLGKLTMRGLEVESIQDLSKGFDNVVIGYVEKREKHPNADRLSVCQVNVGSDVRQIVCGAANVAAGLKVAVSLPGAHLPNGIKIEKGKIRDVESQGMICSQEELGIVEKAEGIWELPKDAPVGKPLAPFIGRDDIIFELNVTPNRGDALSHIGVARELAAILGQKIKMPKTVVSEVSSATASKIKVSIGSGSSGESARCWQYHARFFDGIKIQPSPDWLQKRLMAVGLRPINNVVDVTNYVLMEFGQPLHAFDYSQIKGAHIHVRQAKPGEKLPLLDGSSVECTDDDLVIADSERAVALAGVMGGGNSEVSNATTSILLEAAQFAPASVRKTARRYQKHSDSSHRFERQVDARAVTVAMDRAASLILELAGGKAYGGAVSVYTPIGETLAKGAPRTVAVTLSYLSEFLGINLVQDQATRALTELGFVVEATGDKMSVKVPSYRPDVTLAEDIAEEVLRVLGYDLVQAVVPRIEFLPDPMNSVDQKLKQVEKLKLAMAELGFSEAVNFGFTSKSSNDRWGGIGKDRAVSLANPLNEDLTTMKTSLVGGLFDCLLTGVRHQQSNIRLFEVRPVYFRDDAADTGVREEWRVCALLSGRAYAHSLAARDREVDFYDAKGCCEAMLDTLGTRGARYGAFDATTDVRLHPAQTAALLMGKGAAGFIGRLHPKVEAEFKLRQPVYVIEFSLDRALETAKADRKYSVVSKLPKVDRDLSLLTPQSVASEKVVQAIQKYGKPLVESVSVVDVYAGEKIPSGTLSVSVAMVLGDPNRTLADAEVDGVVQKILSGLDKELQVRLRTQ
jgi:phenylalanyl-tRNA synthetase beta chain